MADGIARRRGCPQSENMAKIKIIEVAATTMANSNIYWVFLGFKSSMISSSLRMIVWVM